ncbi:membrane protein DedA, SNARE-associated domain [Micromonospora halophytica]|uniref:Membrane protein DedA, SNARE-associated domain n=2 Tax=Micromonospora halophytica TaxID=47864 RepID=A0A1C5GUX0_9ACTN|nr:membrane protein DedA, SNARE-associated domain [Micromonospora halophytica]
MCAAGPDRRVVAMLDVVAQIGELPTALLMGVLGLVMLADAVPLLGVLVPGDVAILAAVGLGSPAAGAPTLVAVVAGCVAGWSLSFAAGRVYGERLRHSRVGGWIGEVRWAAAEDILRTGGGRMVLVAPFLPVFNALLPLAAGGLRMSYRRFAACATTGAVLWAGLYLALGTASRSLAGLLPGDGSPVLVTTAVGLALAGVVLLGTRRRLRALTGAGQPG